VRAAPCGRPRAGGAVRGQDHAGRGSISGDAHRTAVRSGRSRTRMAGR